MAFQFIPVTEKNRDAALKLHVAPSQAGTVETVAQCLLEAEAFPLWRPTILRLDDTDIGFAMYGLWKNEGTGGRVWLDRFFIDQRYQGKGLAKACLPPLIGHIRETYGHNRLYLSVYADNAPAIALYKKLGFTFTGELDVNGEKVMALETGV